MQNKLFGPVEIGLTVSIVVLTVGGLVFASLSGIILIPGIPSLLADKRVEKTTKNETPAQESAEPTITVVKSPDAVTSQSSLAAQQTHEPTTAITNSPIPTASPDEATVQDEQVKKDLATLKAALRDRYLKTKDYPTSHSYQEGSTNNDASPLQVLVAEGYLKELPRHPHFIDNPEHSDYFYGYISDGKSFTLTGRLQQTTDPDGTFIDGRYLLVVKDT